MKKKNNIIVNAVNIKKIFIAQKRALISILLICFVFQLVFYSTFNYPSIESCHGGDAKTYVFPEIYSQKVLPRTPVYPAIIAVIKYVSPYEDIPQNIVIVQTIIFFISIIFFYKLAILLLKSKIKVTISTIIYGTLPAFLFYNRVIRVESFSISLFVMFLFIIIKFISSSKIVYGVLSSSMAVILILLRPSFVFLIPCIIVFWIIKCCDKTNIKKHLTGLLSAVCALVIILGYCFYNYKNYNDFTLTDISTYNQLVIAFQSNLYEHGNNDDIISDLSNGIHPHDVFMKYGRTQVSSFVKSVYLSSPSQYIRYHINIARDLMPTSLFTLGGFRQSENIFFKSNVWGNFGQLLYAVMSPFTFSFLIILLMLFFVIIIINTIKQKKLIWDINVLWACVFLQFITGLFGAQAEYARMIVPVIPIVILLSFRLFTMHRLCISMDKE